MRKETDDKRQKEHVVIRNIIEINGKKNEANKKKYLRKNERISLKIKNGKPNIETNSENKI